MRAKFTGRRPPRPLAERVWERVERRGPDECWPTNGTHANTGYALFFLAKADRPPGRCKYTTVPRVVFFVTHGYWPTVCRHTCDNPGCANPDHLRDGTHRDNAHDRKERGRGRTGRGELSGSAKLTEADVRLIRVSAEPNVVLAKHYGVAQSTISRIKTHRRWRHI